MKTLAERMRDNIETKYDVCQYADDGDLWTVMETVKKPVAKTPSRHTALSLAAKLEKAGKE